MRRIGIFALLIATGALTIAERAIASPADQLYPVNLQVNGGEDTWSPRELFQLEWDRPPIADQGFPITAVGYRLRDTGGAVIRDYRLAGDGNRIWIYVLSTPGAYTAEVWLEGPRR